MPSIIFSKLRAGLPLLQPPVPWSGKGRQAAVLVAITDEATPRVWLGRRAQHLPLHPGEVAFPGGKREVIDSSPWATALRETFEEIGVPPELIEPIAELAPLQTRSHFMVYPCIARVPAQLDLVVDAAEFDSVFAPPLATFADPELFRLELMQAGSQLRQVPHYQLGDDNVWGVTAAVLVQVVNVAYDAGLDLQRNWKEKP